MTTSRNGYPGISLYQPVIEPFYGNMNTGNFLLKVAEAMGGTVARAFPWKSYEEVLQFRLKDIGTDWETFKELGVWMQPGYRFAKRGGPHWLEVVGRDRLNAPRDGYFDLYSRELNCFFGKMKTDELAARYFDSGDKQSAAPRSHLRRRKEYPFMLT